MVKDTNIQRSIVLPKEIADKINELAKNDYLTFNGLVRKILVEYVREQEK